MTFSNWWSALLAASQKAYADYKANKPLPPAVPMTGAQAAAGLRSLQAILPGWIAALEAHPGAITAADDVLEALDAQGVIWAPEVEQAINASPGALQAVSGWLPEILMALGAFEPVPNPLPGMGPRVGRG